MDEDWWHLVYDTESSEFHILHAWLQMGKRRISRPILEGQERVSAEGYMGPGAARLAEARADLLARAERLTKGHDLSQT